MQDAQPKLVVKVQVVGRSSPLSTPPLEGAFESILPEEEASPKKGCL